MPTSFGIRDVIPRLAPFAERHPDLHIQLQLGDRRQDLVRDAVDVAIRLGRLPDSTATAKLIATIPRVVVASPDYLARHGAPETPEDLVRHRIVGGTAAAVPTAWRFERGRPGVVIKLEPHFSTDENEGAIAAAVAGFGITSTSGWACRRELENGALVRLLPRLDVGRHSRARLFPDGAGDARRGARGHRSPRGRLPARADRRASLTRHAQRPSIDSISYIEISGNPSLPTQADANDLRPHQTPSVRASRR